MAEAFFADVLQMCTNKDFLNEVLLRFHYFPEALPVMEQVARRMQERMFSEAAWSQRAHEACAPEDIERNERAAGPLYEVAMTLGAGVDALQDVYLSRGLLTESYMVEVLGSEILLRGYEAYNQWVREHSAFQVKRYHFLNDDADLGTLPLLLGKLGLSIACNEAFCMTPRKSVVFYAEWTREESSVCAGICTDCKALHCPNRIAHQGQQMWNFADMTDRPLSYGYAQIWGRSRAERRGVRR